MAYWLLAGQEVFAADSAMGLVRQHAVAPATAPSTRTDWPIPADLDDLVLCCLAKAADDRPQSARELSRRLAAIRLPQAWTDARAHEWWDTHNPARPV